MPTPQPLTNTKVNLLGLDTQALRDYFVSIDEKPYRAEQILKWIHFNGVTDFNAMTNISKDLRQKLSALTELTTPDVIYEKSRGRRHVQMAVAPRGR